MFVMSFTLECLKNFWNIYMLSKYVVMFNVNIKSTAVMLITKKYYFTFLGKHISHNFTIHTDKHNYCVSQEAW